MTRYFKRDMARPDAAAGWFVDGRWHGNSAAKFWCGVLDELASVYPEAVALSLESCVAGPLTPELLDPRASLQRLLEAGPNEDPEGELRRLVQELELLGLPGSVTYRLHAGDGRQIEEGVLPEIDAEILAHLVVWLPEWAGVDRATWNDREIAAAFEADRPQHIKTQSVAFTLNHSALHEGLYLCRVTLHAIAPTTGPTP